MAPEQVRGLPADRRSDIFSFGCVLYEMLAGQRAFSKDSAVETMGSILHEDPPRLTANGRSISSALAAVVRRCLEKRPEDRFQSAHDVALALEELSSTSGASLPLIFAQPWRWRRWFAIAAGVAAAALAVISLSRLIGDDSLPAFEPRQVTTRPGLESEPALSPMGTDIAYTGHDGTRSDIWVVDVRGGQPLRLTADGLAYSTYAERTSLELVDTATHERAHFDPGRLLYDPSIAPDRSSLVFTSNVEGSFDLWRLRLKESRPAGEPERLTEKGGECSLPSFSCDGRWIGFQRVTGGQRDVWIMPAGGGTATNFTDHPAVDINPSWSPDGRRLAFVSNRSGVDQVWIAPFHEEQRSGDPIAIASREGALSIPTWSPDGAWIAFVADTDTASEVWVVSADGSQAPRQLTDGAGAQAAAWNPSTGDVLVLGTWGTPRWVVRRVDLHGGQPRELPAAAATESYANLLEFDLSDDGQLMALLENTTNGDVWVLDASNGSY